MSNKDPILAEAARRLLNASGAADTPAVLWYRLILEMESFRYETGFGLAHTWGFVHDGDYEGARRNFDAVVDDYNENYEKFGLSFAKEDSSPVPPIDLA